MTQKSKNDVAEREKIGYEIHSLEHSVEIWRDVTIPKCQRMIKNFQDELVGANREIAKLEIEIAAKKKELTQYANRKRQTRTSSEDCKTTCRV